MLADSIDGGILALLVLLVALATAGVAMFGLIPALQGKRLLTFVMVSPAIIAVVATVLWIGSGFFTGGQHFPNGPLSDYFGPWLFYAGPPLVASCAVLVVLWFRRRKRQQPQAPEPDL